jgi:hypothetical protein
MLLHRFWQPINLADHPSRTLFVHLAPF